MLARLCQGRARHRWVVLHDLDDPNLIRKEDTNSDTCRLTKWAVRALVRLSRRAALRDVLSLSVRCHVARRDVPQTCRTQSLPIRTGDSSICHLSNTIAVRELCMLAPECILPQAAALAATVTVHTDECRCILCVSRLLTGGL